MNHKTFWRIWWAMFVVGSLATAAIIAVIIHFVAKFW